MNAYVLVGGRSRRMGESKVALFLERVVEAARPVFAEVITVSRPHVIPSVSEGPGREEYEARVSRPAHPGPSLDARDDMRVIFEEPHEAEGAIFGVVRALQDARGKAFLLAVDYPLITSDVLRFLRDREGLPEWNAQPQPLCAVWDAAWLPRIEERIACGALDLRGAFETDIIIPESELRSRFASEPLLNVNTPEEWERAQRFLASR